MRVISGNPISTLDNRSLRQQMTSTHDKSGLMVRSMGGRGPPLQREKTLDMDGNPYAVMVVSAGGVHADTILRVRYRPRIDRRNSKLVSSNGTYGKTWNDQSGPPTAEDQQDFLHWIESGMSVGHLGGSSPLPTDAPPQPAARSSSRLSDKFGHVQGVCRCQRPLIHTGQARASARASPKSRRVHAILNPFSCEQDESIFKAYQKSSYQWVVHGILGLREKTDGPGEMVSGLRSG